MKRTALRTTLAVIGVAVVALSSGCEPSAELTYPTAAELEGMYGPGVTVKLNGNVIDVSARQEASQLRRGGPLWAKVGPYIYLFTPQTQESIKKWSGVGGVRVRTFDSQRDLIAEAILDRGVLNDVTWRKALRTAGLARTQGTERPSYMEKLVRYGEDTARFKYSSKYVKE